MNSAISRIEAIQVLDSRGIPTLAVRVSLRGGYIVTASVPSEMSTGEYEAYELRDGDPREYFGLGVRTAVDYVNRRIAPALVGRDVLDYWEIDRTLIALDGSPSKQILGANTILGVSLAALSAATKVA